MIALLFGCPPNGDTDTDGSGSSDGRTWEVLAENLPGVALSIWGTGSDDAWVVGSSGGAGRPTVLHGDGTTWASVDTGVDGDLWWVFGLDGDEQWFVGADGLILHRVAGTFSQIESPTAATLFGAWGAMGGPVYTVGGFVEEGGGVVVRIEGETATLVEDLPADRDAEELYFKVWGTAADDVYVIGDRGTILHFDGSAWTRVVLPGNPRLVTLHGTGPEDVVVVGGTLQAALWVRTDAGGWEDTSPAGVGPLNGVFVASSGTAVATGMSATVLERSDGVWTAVELPPLLWDWHAAWIDENGALYAAGGDLFGLTDGALVRYE